MGDREPGAGMDQSVALPVEPSELQLEEHRGNVWRLYFGSSYESETGNSPVSGLVSCQFYYFLSLFDLLTFLEADGESEVL